MRQGKRGDRTDFERVLELAHRRPDRIPQPDCMSHADEFVGYDYPLPTPAEAAAMCERCPLLDLCATHARKRRPAWGVWGGSVWVNGRQATGPEDGS